LLESGVVVQIDVIIDIEIEDSTSVEQAATRAGHACWEIQPVLHIDIAVSVVVAGIPPVTVMVAG
jgi:hypothetical protein